MCRKAHSGGSVAVIVGLFFLHIHFVLPLVYFSDVEVSFLELFSFARLNRKLIEGVFGRIVTDRVIVTGERIAHIKERHPEDYELFLKYSKDAVEFPDYIVRDSEHVGTVFMIKKLTCTNLNVVIRLVLETDNPLHMNSVMTFYRIREKNLLKLILKNGFLYKRE